MVSIIIPVYNEEVAVLKVLQDVESSMQKSNRDYEIVVIDDASTDNSKDVIKKSGIKIKYFEHSINKGYGATLKTGIAHSIYDQVLIIDADGTYTTDDIPRLLDGMENYDMVVGSRTGKNVALNPLRKIAKWFIRKLAIYLTGTNIPDLNSGFRVMKKSAVRKFIHILPDGFSFTSTITVAMLTNKYAVKYVPIDYFSREGSSKINPINDTFNFIQLIIRMVLYFNPLSVFMPLSLFLVIFSFIVLFGGWFLFGKTMDVTFGVIMMAAVTIMAIGMLADLIDKRMR